MSPRDRHQSDLRLVQAVLAGKRKARQEFVRRLACVPAFLRTRAEREGRVLESGDLEDLAQEVYLSLWKKLGRFHGASSLETWACGFCILEFRKWRDRSWRKDREVEVAPSAETDFVQPNDLNAVVDSALGRLGPPAEEIIRFKHFEQLTFREIAEGLGMPENSAKSLYYRGLRRLRPWLERAWEGEDLK